MSITRRKFLQGSAVAAVALGSSSLNATELFSPVKKIPHASHFGPFYAYVRDGKIIDIEPQKSDSGPTEMIKALIDRTYSNTRVKYPYVRKSYLENKPNHKELRGNDEFVRVSWEKALDLVAKKIKETPRERVSIMEQPMDGLIQV